MISGFYAAATAAKNNPNAVLIDDMTAFAPVRGHMQWSKANKATTHAWREVSDITGVNDVYDFDSPVPELSVSFSMNSTSLTPYAGSIEIGQDLARLVGDKDSYFVEQARYIARDLGMKLERSVFERLVRTAVDTNRRYIMFDKDDATDQTWNSLAVVTWTGGECCGLFSPVYQRVDTDRIIELEKLSGGNLYQNLKGIPVYGCLFKTVLGLLLANKKMYAVVTNIDTSHKGFAKEFPLQLSAVLDDMLVNRNSMILMSRRLKTEIGNKYTTHATGTTLIRCNEQCDLSVCGVPVFATANLPTKVNWQNIPSLEKTPPSDSPKEN
jgi:hypothetical protein